MITTHSAFIYGHTINNTNFYFAIDEGSGEVLVEINVGAYTLTGFAVELARALNEFTTITNNYDVTVNRATRKLTITADNNFSILITSSSQVTTSAYTLAGFTGSDVSGAPSYESDSSSGSIYNTQYFLQNYVDFEDQQGAQTAIINTPASGNFVEVIQYGSQKMMNCEIKFATDYELSKGSNIRENLTGKSDLRRLMLYITTKSPIEFVPDEADPDTFNKCILDRTPEDSKGTKFLLKEDKKWKETYSTGPIKFREVS